MAKVACRAVGRVIYQVYPRSFADSNGDGIGDLRGLASKLDHLAWLGVDAIWSSPTFPSPNVDWGYDVSDYRDVHPELGTLDDLATLIAEAHERDIDIWLDLVPNHTSDKHDWFSDRPEYYVWSDSIPNDWKSIFTGDSAWEYDARSRRYYLHQFAPEQPDLDWWNPDVRHEFEQILRYWFDRGVTGFRIDVAHGLIKDRELRDGVRYLRERPEVQEIFRAWQAIAHEYDPKPTLMGETYVSLAHLPPYYAAPRPRAELRVHERRVRARRAAADRREDTQDAACWRDAALVRLEPRPLAARNALGLRRRGTGARRAVPPADAARRRDPLPGRRDRARGRQGSRRPHHRPRRPAARPRAHAAAVDALGRGVAEPVAAALEHQAQRRGSARRPRQHAQLRPRPDRAAQGSSATTATRR